MPSNGTGGRERVRTVVMTDGEIDDQSSFHRLLSYTNQLDLLGTISTSSRYQGAGNGTAWVLDAIDAYAADRRSLLRHDPRYPAPDRLRAGVKHGTGAAGMAGVGATHDTEGSDHLVAVLRAGDPRALWVQAWGGTNTLAQALFRLRESHPGDLPRVLATLRLYSIEDQDDGASSLQWMLDEFPGLHVIENDFAFRYLAYPHERRLPPTLAHYLGAGWLDAHVRTGHGALGAAYPGDGSEGDTPAMLHLVPTGLRTLEDPAHGGWGGRFTRSTRATDHWTAAADPSQGGDARQAAGYRWLDAVSADWAARNDWAVRSYADANHHPVAVVDGALDRTVEPGGTVTIDASGSSDPDGDDLAFRVWQYTDAGSNPGAVTVTDADTPRATVTAPDQPGTVHLVVEVTDTGEPALTSYQRVVLTVR